MRKFFLVAMMLTLSVSVIAQQRIQLRSTDRVECTKSDMTSLKASFSFSTIEAKDVDTQRGQFSWLSMANTVIGGNEGDPQIPVVNELIAVPFGANPSIEITSYSTTDYRLDDYGIHTLVPRQPSLRKDQRPEDVPFVYNANAYQTRGLRSAPTATVFVDGTMRGIQVGKMSIEPVSYDPVSNTLRVFNDIEVKVSFDGADTRATEAELLRTYTPYFDIVYAQLFNGRMLRDAYSQHPDLYTTPVKMIVITTSTYANNTTFQSWVNWKKQKGIYTTVYTTSETGTTSANIKSFIRNKYNTDAPTFVVVVGDTGDVTYSLSSSTTSKVTDLYYSSTTDSDLYPEMFYSRMPVSSTTELTNLLNKIMTYEKYTMADPSYLGNTLLIAGWDSSWTPKVGKPTIQYANNYYFNSSNGINPYVYLTTASGQTSCYNNINNVGFVNYTAHGGETGWSDPSFSVSQVNSMTNNDKYLWAMGNCCLAANWGYSGTCFAEAMLRAANKGAFGYIGSCPETYWYEDYYFGVGATTTFSQMPTQAQTQTGVYDAMFDDSGFNTLNSVPFLGNIAVAYAHAGSYQSSTTDKYYWEAYHCLGDGSVMPYHTVPAANNVSHANTISIGATTFTVSAVAGSYVAITKNNEILGVAQVPSSGTVNVPISGLTSAGDVMIVVTRQQRQPYITTIQAVATTGPYITLDSYTPNSAIIGQVTGLSMTFKNVGTAATSGTTTVTLSSSNSNALVVDTPSKTFSSLAANATTTVSGFQFHFTSNATVGFNYTLHYTAVNGSNTWEGDITVTADQVYTVSVESNNNNYGTVSGGGQYHYGASCTVSATAADGYMFTNWTQNGNVVSTSAAYTFTVSSNVSLVANFASGVMIGDGSSSTSEYLPSYNYYNYTLSEQIYTSAELGGAGTITSIAFYNEGAEKTRKYDFYMKTTTKSSFTGATDWVAVSSGDKVFSGDVTMVANDWTTITLSTPFVYDGTSNVVLVADDNSGAYSYSPHMTCRVFTATNQALYIYSDNTNYNPASPSSYNGTRLSSKNQIILTKEPISTEPVNVTVTVSPANAGVVSGAGTYDPGTTATLTATANEGYTFANWTKNGVVMSTSATYSFTVTTAAAYVANFTLNSYTVTATANPAEGGTVSFGRNRDDLVYDFEDGWQNWTAFKGTTGTSSHNWMHNTEYVAYDSNGNQIVPECHNSSTGMMLSESYISASTSGGSGTAVTPDNYLVSPQFRLGGSFTFYAASRMSNYPAEKFSVLVSESGNNSASYFTHTELTVTLSDNSWHEYTVDLSAYSGMGYVAIRHWDCNDQHLLYVDDVTIVEGQDGSTGSGNFNYGETCVVTAIPNAEYNFVNWTENGSAVSSDATYAFTVTGDRALVANFSQNLGTQYTITANANPTAGGTVSGAGTYNENGTCTLTATAATGYTFVNWTKDGVAVSTNATYSFTVTGDATYVANFALNSYEVAATANPTAGGTISGAGTYSHGATVTLTATANEGYTFTNWTRNGVAVSTNATYSFTVTGDAAYVANFTLNSYTVTATANPTEGGTVTVGTRTRDDLVYDFEDGWQEWTTFQGNTTSPNSWMHNTAYPTTNNNFSTGYGYDNSDGFMLSESYISGSTSGSGTAVTPDNYLVSPQVRLGGSISFYAGARNTSYCAEKFSVMVSTTGNSDAASFTTVGTWTLSLSQAGYNSTPYTVDLSAYSGMGYVAIRHFDCYDQWFLAVDNVTIVEGPDNSTGSGDFNYGETCVVTATPMGDYHFVNWTQDGAVVSTDASYSFTVTEDADLVANFAIGYDQTVTLSEGVNWWSTYLDITLEDLKSAIEAALEGTGGEATIKSNTGFIRYQGGQWRPSSMAFDIRRMYQIQVSTGCTITLTGVPVDPADYPITIHSGVNWIGYLSGGSMTVEAAFSGLNPVNGDIIKSKDAYATYNGTRWRGGLGTLEPGKGYIYQSKATEDKTFTYGTNNNK